MEQIRQCKFLEKQGSIKKRNSLIYWTYVSRKILLLAQDSLVAVKFAVEYVQIFLCADLVRFQSVIS